MGAGSAWRPGRTAITSADHPAPSRYAKYVIAFALAAVFASLYLRGLDFGHPICEHGDEWALTEQGMRMAATGPFHPLREYSYGSLGIFIQCGVCAVVHAYNNAFGVYRDADNRPIHKDLEKIAKDATDRDQFRFFWAGRVSSACYAAILFWILYRLGMVLFASRWAACAAVLAAMVHPLLMQQAHFSLPNVLATMLAVASVYCSIVFVERGALRWIYLAAVLAGMAIGAKVTVIWAFAVVVAAVLWQMRVRGIKHVPLLALTFAAAYVVVEPYILFDARQFYGDFAKQARDYGRGAIMDSRNFQQAAFGPKGMRELAERWTILHPILHWAHQGAGYFALTLAGLIALPFLAGRKGTLMLLFPLLMFVFIGIQRKVLTTNYVPLVPFYALGLGAIACGVIRGLGGRPKLAAACVVILSSVALAAPARTSYNIARQFTTTDPYQTALAWIESNVPRNARVFAERGMLAAFPFSNEGMRVKLGFFTFFTQPYADFLEYDYVIALSPGLYDRFPWLDAMFLGRKNNKAEFEGYLRNRRLSEKRLILERHVTPEECGYVAYAETPIVAHDVYIYKVPKVTPARFLPPPPPDKGDPHWSVTAGQPTETALRLDPGRYDLFLQAKQHASDPGVVSFLNVQIDSQTPWSVCLPDYIHSPLFVSSIDIEAPQEVRLRVTLDANPSSTVDECVWITGIECFPFSGEPMPGTPAASK